MKLGLLFASLGATGALLLTSCETRSGTGALIGGATGAGLGAIVADDSPGAGALVGGAIGAATGAIIGDVRDRRYGYGYVYDEDYDDPYYGRAAYVPAPVIYPRQRRIIYDD